jgi:hypothetical protein
MAPGCPNDHGGACLGPLPAGTYSTTRFQPALTYTVPDEWDNEEDLTGNFLLLPPGGDLAGVDAGTSDYIGVYTSVTPDPGCAAGPDSLLPQAIAMCLAQNPTLQTTEPKAVDIGGLKGDVLDITATSGGGSLIDGIPPSDFEHGIGPGLTIRLYLLEFGSGSLAIEVDDVGSADLDSYSAVIEKFHFDT